MKQASIARKLKSSDMDDDRPNAATDETATNVFDRKTERNSSDLYFYYYGQLQHQQNMLQDYVRTGAYYSGIVDNRVDFEGRTVMDVGAGSGILSLFAAQAGAQKVIAVEASDMATYAQLLADANPVLGSRIEVHNSKLEELSGVERVDVLVSEPMGTLLVNERMLETYIYARDHFLKPGGQMFPHMGRIHVALFSDPMLYAEVSSKGAFWLQRNFFGVDISRLHGPAMEGYFSQVVVDAIDASAIVSACASKTFDFTTVTEEELQSIEIPVALQAERQCEVHGVAIWFDVLFRGTTVQRWLSTAPGSPTTHWFQLRCVLKQPLTVNAGDFVRGNLSLQAHNRQSYDVFLTLTAPPSHPKIPAQQVSGKFDLKEPFYRQLTAWDAQTAAQQQTAAPSLPQLAGAALNQQQQQQ